MRVEHTNLAEQLENIVLSALENIDRSVEPDRFNVAFNKYVATLRVPLDRYRDHSAQGLPAPETLQIRFKYETALLHVITRALVYAAGSPKGIIANCMPIYQPDNLFDWYSLPEHLCLEIDRIATDIVSSDFFRSFIPNLSRHIQSRTGEHDLGEFYTPAPIVEHLIEAAGLNGRDIVEGKRVIDPACGSGIILMTIAQSVVDYCQTGGCDTRTALTALAENLFGFDVQPFAVSLTKSLLLYISSALITSSTNPIPQFPNVRLIDTLTTDREYWTETGYFHYVIGNPPFVSVKKQHVVHADKYEEILFGHPNLYQFFLWWAVKATVPNGKISFVLPQSILIGIYSKQLRAKLDELTIPLLMTRMIDRYNVVADADQQMMVACFQVKPPEEIRSGLVEVRVTRNGTDIHSTKPKPILGKRIIRTVANSTIWVVSDNKYDYTILETLEARSCLLSELSDTFQTGNGSFVWNQHKELLSADEQEHSIPLISSASINPYLAEFPYTGNHQTRQRLFAHITPEVEQKQHTGAVLLVQRTTPRKAGRRVVAGILPAQFHSRYPYYFLENHVNYVHMKNPGESNLLYALNVWLNSDIVNFAFQLRNGTAHISLFEMNILPVVPQLLNEISDQATEISSVSKEIRQNVIDRLNLTIFDWLELGEKHRQRIEQVMHRRERATRS